MGAEDETGGRTPCGKRWMISTCVHKHSRAHTYSLARTHVQAHTHTHTQRTPCARGIKHKHLKIRPLIPDDAHFLLHFFPTECDTMTRKKTRAFGRLLKNRIRTPGPSHYLPKSEITKRVITPDKPIPGLPTCPRPMTEGGHAPTASGLPTNYTASLRELTNDWYSVGELWWRISSAAGPMWSREE